MKFTPQSLKDYSFLSNLRIGPDGKQLVYECSRVRSEKNDYSTDLYLWDTEKKESRRLTTSGKDHSALWEEEQTVLFCSGREKKNKKQPETDYFRIRTNGGEAEPAFTVLLAVSQIEPLGDGQWLLIGEYDPDWEDYPKDSAKQKKFVDEREKEKDWKVLEDLPFWWNGQGYTGKKRSRLYRFTESDGTLTPLTDPDTEVESLRINREKTRAAVIQNKRKRGWS